MTSESGVIACRVITEPIDTRALEATVSSIVNGAVVTFVGQVRNVSRGREVAYLEYRAYEGMAAKQMRKIAEDAALKWGVQIALEHRVGRLELGEASVVVCVGSRHRGDAFDACRYVIDTLKQDVPIWKREVCPDGAFWIEGEAQVEAAT